MRISFLFLAVSLALAATGCTIEPKGTETHTEFNPPLVYDTWKTDHMTDAKGSSVCVVTSGSSGYTFVIRKTADGHIVSLQSGHAMEEGETNIVTVNGHRYETKQQYFEAKDAVAMAQDFSEGDKAYAEWLDQRGGPNGLVHYTKIYRLQGFKKLFDSCLN